MWLYLHFPRHVLVSQLMNSLYPDGNVYITDVEMLVRQLRFYWSTMWHIFYGIQAHTEPLVFSTGLVRKLLLLTVITGIRLI